MSSCDVCIILFEMWNVAFYRIHIKLSVSARVPHTLARTLQDSLPHTYTHTHALILPSPRAIAPEV